MKGFAPLVLVCDRRVARAQTVSQLAEDCGAKLIQVAEGAPVGQQLNACLILLSGEGTSETAFSALVQRWSAQGVAVVCYADNLARWPLGKRCRLLLAGARSVLDSAAPSFAFDLRATLEKLLAAHVRRAKESEELHQLMQASGVVGRSEAILAVYRWARKASLTSDLPVLITGETGTGKELLARAIHQFDPKRSRHPFVAVNCSTISPTLAESELFGHQRGAYTGGDWQRAGFFRAADQGVIFLDEIGELELSLQAKLLRVLQENKVRSLGEDREASIDVRVVAATNRPLLEMIERGTFRADLFHRLQVLPIHLPPLRERREDIAPLVQHLVASHNEQDSTQMVAAPEFVEALRQLELPGNIRQLENLVRGAMARKEDDSPLSLTDLPEPILEELSRESPAAKPLNASGAIDLESHLQALLTSHNWNLSESLAHCERLMLTSAVKQAQGNQSRAAQLMGITPRTVHNKLRRFKITTESLIVGDRPPRPSGH